MLSPPNQISFLLFALLTLTLSGIRFRRLYRQIARGREDTEDRFSCLPRRVWYAFTTTILQTRTFRKRPWVSFFHSFIFYGFVFYLLVNLIDALDGYFPLTISSTSAAGATYNLLADLLSALVLVGVIALVLRRSLLPSRRDFTFNLRTLLHEDVRAHAISRDSAIVSAFILFHVGSRAIGAGARIAATRPDPFQPFASLLSHLFTPAHAHLWITFGYWGALGSVLAFLVYFPASKHVHIFLAPAKYLVARPVKSGVLPALALDLESEDPKLGANKLEDLAWPRLLDAYACIQCNRCQDVCPATATGKSLSPSALEINKRMELNTLARTSQGFPAGAPSPRPLLAFALSPEAAWACTTCGACLEVCPVQDEPMLDIIDVRRNQVMLQGEFPSQLQTAFRGMERSSNPWGLGQEKRLDWAHGLHVPTTDQNPEPDVLYWVGCAPSYDPQSQKTARAFVQLLNHARVNFAVLGKKECCTGDSARRAGNEYLYLRLAEQNVTTLNTIKPRLIVTTCPHCMNSIGKEYAQLGGNFRVLHHTEYLETLIAEGRITADPGSSAVAFHDPCYLGRHNGVYDAPRNLLNILSNNVVELDRNRENSFCCGAGGAQFWKEEEPGEQRISDNRYAEARHALRKASDPVLAVGCPFCKSMLESTPAKGDTPLPVRDIAELLLEGVLRRSPPQPQPALAVSEAPTPAPVPSQQKTSPQPISTTAPIPAEEGQQPAVPPADSPRKKWTPKSAQSLAPATPPPGPQTVAAQPEPPKRKTWAPKTGVKTSPSTAAKPNPDPEPPTPSGDS